MTIEGVVSRGVQRCTQVIRSALACALLLLGVSCSLQPAAPSAVDGASLDASLQFCSDEINRLRARVGRSALTRSSSLENFASAAAQHDASAGVPHLFFRNTNGGGISRAETELLLWKNYQVRDVIRQGLAQMWTSAGDHYDVLVGPYTEVGCGVFVNGSEVSVAQDFR
jgi:uncharacterized protein YkwD